ncbi:MAG TPA: UDP-N-acetylglucosamine 4,6-dehydratase (inverting) [Thermoanaerobaculia bacterium]|nr:UDP-N-acetylglucosamine 4,6-dehydratase (inverting) [Thermoanaerobaculia bacterium]
MDSEFDWTSGSVLVTGGTGSFGRAFIARLLADYPGIRRIVVYSRDELKQFEMAHRPPFAGERRLRFFLGDVRDRDRVRRALEGIDTVIHAAALKQIPAAEYNPFEVIKTNVLGAQNVIEGCLDQGVKRVVALSTDKAAAPINLYGATKLCSDKLFVASNNFKGSRDLRLGVVRYGNVMGSRGSVIPFFLSRPNDGVLPITSPEMTRFSLTLDEGIELVLFALGHMWGGEIFVPRIPSYRILDLAEAIAPGCRTEVIGLRPGEKVHEEMITVHDAPNTIAIDRCFVIEPPLPTWDVAQFRRTVQGEPVPEDFSYNSLTNSEWLSVERLRELIRLHVDPTFSA